MADANSKKTDIELAIRDSMSSALQGIAREMAATNQRAQEMASSGSGYGNLNKLFTSMTDKLISPFGLAGAFVATSKALDSFATNQLQLQNFARDTGFAAGQVQEYRQQLGLLGVPLAQADQMLGKFAGNMQSAMAIPWANNFVTQIMRTNAPLAVRIQTLVSAGQQGKVGKEIYDAYINSNQAGKEALVIAADMSHTQILALGQDTTGLIKEWELLPGAELEYHKNILNVTQTQSNIWKSIASNAISGIVGISGGWEGMDAAAHKVAEFINIEVNKAFFDFTIIIKDVKAFVVWLDGRAEASTTDTLADIGEAGYKGMKKSGVLPKRNKYVELGEPAKVDLFKGGKYQLYGDESLLGEERKKTNETLTGIYDILKKMFDKGQALPQKRQEGGAVLEDQPYEVGEAGPEVFAAGGGYRMVGEGGPEVIRPQKTGRIVSEIEAMGRDYQPSSPTSQMLGSAMGLGGLTYGAAKFLKGHAGAGDEMKSKARKLFGIEDPGEPAPWTPGGEWSRGPSSANSLASREQGTPDWMTSASDPMGSLSSREQDTPAWMSSGAVGKPTSEEAQRASSFNRVREAASAAGSPNPELTAAIAMYKSGWLGKGNDKSVFASSGGTNPFGQTGVGPAGFVVGRDRQKHAVYENLEQGVAAHMKRWGSMYGDTPEQTLSQMVKGGYNTVNPEWKSNINKIYSERLTKSLSEVNGGKPSLNANIIFKGTPPGVTTSVRGEGIDTLKSTNNKQLTGDFSPAESGMDYGY